MEIQCDAKALARFKKVARAKSPLEYLEMLYGRVTEHAIKIVKSVPIKHVASLTSEGAGSCDFDDKELPILKLKAEKDGLTVVGSIHSHPGYSTNSPSEDDNTSAIDNREKVFGIYSFTKNTSTGRCAHSKLCFYLPQVAVQHKRTRGIDLPTKEPHETSSDRRALPNPGGPLDSN